MLLMPHKSLDVVVDEKWFNHYPAISFEARYTVFTYHCHSRNFTHFQQLASFPQCHACEAHWNSLDNLCSLFARIGCFCVVWRGLYLRFSAECPVHILTNIVCVRGELRKSIGCNRQLALRNMNAVKNTQNGPTVVQSSRTMTARSSLWLQVLLMWRID